jgi:hypothetical protein
VLIVLVPCESIPKLPRIPFEVNFLKYLIPPKIETYLPKDTTLRLRD